jgi:hypothetical protein
MEITNKKFPIIDHEFVPCCACHGSVCSQCEVCDMAEDLHARFPMVKVKSGFEKWKFAGSLPQILVMYSAPSIPMGAFQPDFDTLKVQTDDRFVMRQVLYTTPKRIHGLLHYDASNQLFFIGYECGKCEQVFLVPDSVDSEDKLQRSLQHGCSGGPTQ